MLLLQVVSLERPLLHNAEPIDFPQLDGAIGRARRDELAVVREARGKDSFRMSDRARLVDERSLFFARDAIIQEDLTVRPGRDKQRAVRRIRDGLNETSVLARRRLVLEGHTREENGREIIRARPEAESVSEGVSTGELVKLTQL